MDVSIMWTVPISLIASVIMFYIFYKFSHYYIIRDRLGKTRLVSLVALKKNGKILFRFKSDEPFPNMWTLPGGEVGLDREFIKEFKKEKTKIDVEELLTNEKYFPYWAEYFTKKQLDINIGFPKDVSYGRLRCSYYGDIQAGYPPTEVFMYLAKPKKDGKTARLLKEILEDKVSGKKFFSMEEIEEHQKDFPNFYLENKDLIFGIEASYMKKKQISKKESKIIKKTIQTIVDAKERMKILKHLKDKEI